MIGAPTPDLLRLPSPPPPQVQELQDSLLRLEPFPPPSRGQAGASGSGSSSSGVDEEPWETQVSMGSVKTTIFRSLGFWAMRLKSWSCDPGASGVGKGLTP